MRDGADRPATMAAAAGACILTTAGGAMDAWVYLEHGHLFANAQTGNVVLFALHATAGEAAAALHVLPSIAAFVVGLLVSRLTGAWLKARGRNSRTPRLAAEFVLLLILGSVAGRLANDIVTASVGFIAAVQITSLSHIGSASFNTGMTTGNLRAAVSAAVAVMLGPSGPSDRERALILAGLCLSFPVGAILGGLCARRMGDGTVFVLAGLVGCAAVMMRRAPDPLPGS